MRIIGECLTRRLRFRGSLLFLAFLQSIIIIQQYNIHNTILCDDEHYKYMNLGLIIVNSIQKYNLILILTKANPKINKTIFINSQFTYKH